MHHACTYLESEGSCIYIYIGSPDAGSEIRGYIRCLGILSETLCVFVALSPILTEHTRLRTDYSRS